MSHGAVPQHVLCRSCAVAASRRKRAMGMPFRFQLSAQARWQLSPVCCARKSELLKHSQNFLHRLGRVSIFPPTSTSNKYGASHREQKRARFAHSLSAWVVHGLGMAILCQQRMHLKGRRIVLRLRSRLPKRDKR